MTAIRRAASLVVVLLLGACASGANASPVSPPAVTTSASIGATPTFAPPPDASTVDGSCGATPLWKGSIPPTLELAAGNNAPKGLPVVIGQPAIVAGFVFSYPLRAGHPEDPSNKVLWVVASGREGPLQVDAHPLDAPAPSLRYSFADSSGPGNIYPSGIDVPSAGCWHLTFTWSGRSAAVDLVYR